MRRTKTGMAALLLALLLPVGALGSGSVQPAPFWWDTSDTDITTQSSGTGGSPAYWADFARGGIAWQNESDILEMPGIGAAYAAWVADTTTTDDRYQTDIERHLVDGRLLQVVWRETYHAEGRVVERLSDPPDWRVYARAVDVETGEVLALSDLFYDGVNYIAYINDWAMSALLGGGNDADSWERYQVHMTEDDLRRPFSGFPRDYPYFQIGMGPHGGRMLGLSIATENPLFTPAHSHQSPVLWIPLEEDVSPYGMPWVEVRRAENAYGVYAAQVSLPGGDPAVERKLNAALAELADWLVGHHPLKSLHVEAEPVAYVLEYGERLLSIQYYAYDRNHAELYMACLGMMLLDMETGEEVDCAGLWDLQEEGVQRYRRIHDGPLYYNWMELPEAYQPGGADLYLGASLADWSFLSRDRVLQVAWLEAEGEEGSWEAWLEIPEKQALKALGMGE